MSSSSSGRRTNPIAWRSTCSRRMCWQACLFVLFMEASCFFSHFLLTSSWTSLVGFSSKGRSLFSSFKSKNIICFFDSIGGFMSLEGGFRDKTRFVLDLCFLLFIFFNIRSHTFWLFCLFFLSSFSTHFMLCFGCGNEGLMWKIADLWVLIFEYICLNEMKMKTYIMFIPLLVPVDFGTYSMFGDYKSSLESPFTFICLFFWLLLFLPSSIRSTYIPTSW